MGRRRRRRRRIKINGLSAMRESVVLEGALYKDYREMIIIIKSLS
jgi:hypothetical protein